MTRRPLVIVFARVPQLGRVKTRLARGIGALGALRFFRAMLAQTLRRLGRDPRWETAIAATPDRLAGGAWRGRAGLGVRRQGSGDLGRRMVRAMRAVRGRRVLIVGCDIPDLDAAAVAEALRRLAAHQVVIGPSSDGGFWTIGWRGTPPRLALLDGVRWSASTTRAETVARLGRRRVAYARTLDDVDEASDLARLRPSPSP